MKVLITEDDADKRDTIVGFMVSKGVDAADIVSACDMADFMAKFDNSISICIIDLRIPAYDGAGAERNGIGVLQAIERKGVGQIKLLAISGYPEEFESIREHFESRGCMLVDFNQKEVWQSILTLMIIQAQSSEPMDFLIFCALRSERAPFTAMSQLNGSPVFKDNLVRFDITLDGRKGTVIDLPRIGLVDASVVAGACIEKFKPKVVAMSGVCAGFAGRAELGQLLVSELAYEYQSGKWTADGFSQDPYQAPISEKMRTVARELLEDPGLLSRLELGWQSDRPSTMCAPRLATFTSGSAVIANDELMTQVGAFHRRVSGLDMEIFGIHRAAQVAHCEPEVLCAKTVVDLAGADKNDLLQPYGGTISARFIVAALGSYFNKRI